MASIKDLKIVFHVTVNGLPVNPQPSAAASGGGSLKMEFTHELRHLLGIPVTPQEWGQAKLGSLALLDRLRALQPPEA